MPPKRKALASAQNSPSRPPKRSRKASPTSPSPRPNPARKALQSKPSTPPRATRSSARRAALSSSPAPEPAVPPSPVLHSSASAPAHIPAPASLGAEARLSSPDMDEEPSAMFLQSDILTLELEKRICYLGDENALVKGRNKKMGTNLNLARTQIAANEKKTDTALQAQLSLANAQHTADIAIITQLEKKIAELEETNQSLRARTSKVNSTHENLHEEVDSDEEGNVWEPDNNALWGRITELDTGREEERKEAKELGKKVEELEERIQNGVRELAEANKDLQDCEDELERVKDEKASVQARLEDAIAELNNVDGLAQELEHAQRGKRKVEGQLEKTRRGEKEAKVELEKAKRSERDANRTLVSKQKDVDNGIAEIQELEAKLDAATSSLEGANQEMAAKHTELEERWKQVNDLEGKLDAATAKLEQKAQKAMEMEKKLGKMEKEMEKQDNFSAHLQEAADGHLRTKRDLEKMVNALTAEVVKMRGAVKIVGRSGRVDFGLNWE